MPQAEDKTAAHDQDKNPFAGKIVHLIGIGGTGMRALAQMLLESGASVSGSDATPWGPVERLKDQGAVIHTGQNPDNVPDGCDLVVYSAAIDSQNPELAAARQSGAEVVKYSEMLGRLMARRMGIAIAGTHGKSTTTAMVAYVLVAAGKRPSFVVGATVDQLGGPSGVGPGEHFVAEACEFDRSFLHLSPCLGAILNIEEDHLDCYSDVGAIVEAFRAFTARIDPAGVLIANGEDRNVAEAVRNAACEVQTFGFDENCRWRGANLVETMGRYQMDVLFDGELYCRLPVPLTGLHNAYNALSAIALLHHAGVDNRRSAALLSGFTGTQRRMTPKAQAGGITILDDYAHHPTEIQVTLRAIQQTYRPQRLICVFQPHQYSRTRFLLNDFARSFGAADETILPDIYFVRDSVREKDYISSKDLVSQIRLHGGRATYLRSFDEICAHLREYLEPGDVVVTMGAGDIWKVADEIVRWLSTRDRD